MSLPHEDFLQLIQHVDRLLNSPTPPDLPEELQEDPSIVKLHTGILQLRQTLLEFSRGNVSKDIDFRGFSAGCLKGLQAHLRHFVWQVQQVERGDFSQRIDFLGDFSTHFNHMIEQLDSTMKALHQKEEALLELTKSLQYEVELRNSAMNALSQSEAKFRYLAEHDPLTGCLNRRSFFGNAVQSLLEARLGGHSACIALLDIDFFKHINDTFGHQEGDKALQHIVSIAKSALRGNDMLGRYGGEEFIFYFASIGLEEGMKVADRIRNLIKSQPVVLSGGDSLNLTVSFGLSAVMPEYPGERTQSFLEQVIKQVDDALYAAKKSGRDKVVSAPLLGEGGSIG